MTPKNIDPLEAEIDKMIASASEYPVNKVRLKQSIKALIATAVKSARVEELKHIVLEGDMSAYTMINKETKRIKDRIKELSALNSTEGE